jgi:hypothetical protein
MVNAGAKPAAEKSSSRAGATPLSGLSLAQKVFAVAPARCAHSIALVIFPWLGTISNLAGKDNHHATD